jgi:hypothetical protein
MVVMFGNCKRFAQHHYNVRFLSTLLWGKGAVKITSMQEMHDKIQDHLTHLTYRHEWNKWKMFNYSEPFSC